MMRRLIHLALLLVLAGCGTTSSVVHGPSAEDLDIDVCVFPGKTDSFQMATARQFDDKKRPFFRKMKVVRTRAEAKDCDLVVRVESLGTTIFSPTVGDAYSMYSDEKLWHVEAKGYSQSQKVGRAIFNAFQKGTPLYSRIMNERAMAPKASPEPPARLPARSRAQPRRLPASAKVAKIENPKYWLEPRVDDFALVVGIEEYSDLPSAKFAKRDAEAFKNHMLAMGVPRRNVIHLAGSKAGRSALVKYLNSWLPRNVKPSSRVYFYFSGHGAPDPKTGQAYLMPWDGDPGFLKDTAYPVKRLYKSLAKLKAKEVVIALDACFSGAGGRSVLSEGARPLVTKTASTKLPKGNLTLLTAAESGEITATLKDKGHGMFTYFLLKGLNGSAKDASGRITTRSLYDYLKPQVQDEARRQNREQTPAFHSKSDVVLRRVP